MRLAQIERNIELHIEERNSQDKKYHASYDRDIKKLRAFALKISKTQRALEELENAAGCFWNSVGI
jgi:hypothetical protein